MCKHHGVRDCFKKSMLCGHSLQRCSVVAHLAGQARDLPRGHPRIPDLSRLDSGTFPFGLAPDPGFPGPFAPNIHVFSGADPRHSGPFPFRFRTFPGWSLLVVGVSCPPLLRRFAFLHSQFSIPPENNSSWRFRRSGQVGQGLPRVARVVGVSCVCGLPCL